MKKQKRGRGRPPIWKTLLLEMKWGEKIPAQNKSQAMAIYIAARRLGFTTETRLQPDGSYLSFKRKPKTNG